MATFAHIEAENGGKFPGFAVLRHLLAVLILMDHCRGLVAGAAPVADQATLTEMSFVERIVGLPNALMSVDGLRPLVFALVASFFALSGFLVTGSALRTARVRTFLAFRVLRIVPALFSEVTLSAIVLGACLTSLPLADYYTHPEFWRYFGNIGGFVWLTLPGVFTHNPVPNIVNANLWTLKPEFWCYLAMALAIGAGWLKNRRLLAIGFSLTALGLVVLTWPGVDILATRNLDKHFEGWLIVWMFVSGVMFYRFEDRIPYNFGAAALSAVAYYVGMLLRIPDVISCAFLVYATMSFGALTFKRFEFLDRYDYSYGPCLYGYPIAQTLVFLLMRAGWLAPRAPVYVFVMAATFTLTLAFSAASWRFIEKPVLGLKRHFVPKKPATAKSAPASVDLPRKLAA